MIVSDFLLPKSSLFAGNKCKYCITVARAISQHLFMDIVNSLSQISHKFSLVVAYIPYVIAGEKLRQYQGNSSEEIGAFHFWSLLGHGKQTTYSIESATLIAIRGKHMSCLASEPH